MSSSSNIQLSDQRTALPPMTFDEVKVARKGKNLTVIVQYTLNNQTKNQELTIKGSSGDWVKGKFKALCTGLAEHQRDGEKVGKSSSFFRTKNSVTFHPKAQNGDGVSQALESFFFDHEVLKVGGKPSAYNLQELRWVLSNRRLEGLKALVSERTDLQAHRLFKSSNDDIGVQNEFQHYLKRTYEELEKDGALLDNEKGELETVAWNAWIGGGTDEIVTQFERIVSDVQLALHDPNKLLSQSELGGRSREIVESMGTRSRGDVESRLEATLKEKLNSRISSAREKMDRVRDTVIQEALSQDKVSPGLFLRTEIKRLVQAEELPDDPRLLQQWTGRLFRQIVLGNKMQNWLLNYAARSVPVSTLDKILQLEERGAGNDLGSVYRNEVEPQVARAFGRRVMDLGGFEPENLSDKDTNFLYAQVERQFKPSINVRLSEKPGLKAVLENYRQNRGQAKNRITSYLNSTEFKSWLKDGIIRELDLSKLEKIVAALDDHPSRWATSAATRTLPQTFFSLFLTKLGLELGLDGEMLRLHVPRNKVMSMIEEATNLEKMKNKYIATLKEFEPPKLEIKLDDDTKDSIDLYVAGFLAPYQYGWVSKGEAKKRIPMMKIMLEDLSLSTKKDQASIQNTALQSYIRRGIEGYYSRRDMIARNERIAESMKTRSFDRLTYDRNDYSLVRLSTQDWNELRAAILDGLAHDFPELQMNQKQLINLISSDHKSFQAQRQFDIFKGPSRVWNKG